MTTEIQDERDVLLKGLKDVLILIGEYHGGASSHATLNKIDKVVRDVSDQVRPVPKETFYIASKCSHAARWRDLRDRRGFRILASWIEPEGDMMPFGAVACIAEAAAADVFVLYHEAYETQRGALVELGAALAVRALTGKAVDVRLVGCGGLSADSLFLSHPNVRRFNTIEDALWAGPAKADAPGER